jgi:hypothetical protein
MSVRICTRSKPRFSVPNSGSKRYPKLNIQYSISSPPETPDLTISMTMTHRTPEQMLGLTEGEEAILWPTHFLPDINYDALGIRPLLPVAISESIPTQNTSIDLFRLHVTADYLPRASQRRNSIEDFTRLNLEHFKPSTIPPILP